MHCCIYMKLQAYGFLAADIDHFMHYIVYGPEFTMQTWRKETGEDKDFVC
jgi:hypothetical protein